MNVLYHVHGGEAFFGKAFVAFQRERGFADVFHAGFYFGSENSLGRSHVVAADDRATVGQVVVELVVEIEFLFGKGNEGHVEIKAGVDADLFVGFVVDQEAKIAVMAVAVEGDALDFRIF